MRIRTIKPEFFLHGSLYELEIESQLPVRLVFIGLWCAADREGRFQWDARKLKVQILPYDNIDFPRVLDALATRGFIVRYALGTREFGAIPSFKKHQVINNREKKSEIPDFADPNAQVIAPPPLLTRAPRVSDACPTPLNLDQEEGKGREGKGIASSDASNTKGTVQAETPLLPGLAPVLIPSPPVPPPPSPNEKERDEFKDLLISLDGTDPNGATKGAWGRACKALADIRAAMPNVTIEEIQRRVANYKKHYPGMPVTCTAISNNWGMLNNAPKLASVF